MDYERKSGRTGASFRRLPYWGFRVGSSVILTACGYLGLNSTPTPELIRSSQPIVSIPPEQCGPVTPQMDICNRKTGKGNFADIRSYKTVVGTYPIDPNTINIILPPGSVDLNGQALEVTLTQNNFLDVGLIDLSPYPTQVSPTQTPRVPFGSVNG